MKTNTQRVNWTAGITLGLVLLPASAGAQSGFGPQPYDEPGMDVIEIQDLQPRPLKRNPQRLPDPTALPDPAVALDSQLSGSCRHGVVCAKKPGTDVLLEARTGYTFGDWSPVTVEATFGLGNFGLGLPRNILFIAEVGLTTDTQASDAADVRFKTVDFSGGIRAFWPTRGPFALYGDVLFGGASHWLQMDRPVEGADHLWNIMGQLAVGFELHLVGPLSLVGRAKASFFGLGGALLVAAAANGEPQALAYAQNTTRHEPGSVRLALTAGPSLSF